jgi:hypothetical protein
LVSGVLRRLPLSRAATWARADRTGQEADVFPGQVGAVLVQLINVDV